MLLCQLLFLKETSYLIDSMKKTLRQIILPFVILWFWNSCLPFTGTCVNNTSVMMFKKGSFEIGCTIFPVAIKVGFSSPPPYEFPCRSQLQPRRAASCLSQYDFRFGDAYWNSSKFGLVHHLLRIMSSWGLVCSVWYLPPMNREVTIFHNYYKTCFEHCLLTNRILKIALFHLSGIIVQELYHFIDKVIGVSVKRIIYDHYFKK